MKMKITEYLRGNKKRTQFRDKYGIPVRTLEDWDAGRSNPPEYVINLLARAVYEDKLGAVVRFVVYDIGDHDEAILINTTDLTKALSYCGAGTDKHYTEELRVIPGDPEAEDFELGDYDLIDWSVIE